MGSIYPRKNKIWIQFKSAEGKWTQRTTPFHVGQEPLARKLLARVEEKIAAGKGIAPDEPPGPCTLRR